MVFNFMVDSCSSESSIFISFAGILCGLIKHFPSNFLSNLVLSLYSMIENDVVCTQNFHSYHNQKT